MADTFFIPYLRSVWQTLRYKLGERGKIVIFGAGRHTRWLLSVTESNAGPTVVCILDDNPCETKIAGIPVYHTSQANLDDFDLVLISSDRWEDQLFERAQSLWNQDVEIMRLYEGMTLGPYDKSDDRSRVLDHRRQGNFTKPIRANQVVLVCDQPRSREAKIGYALSSAGMEVVLLSHQAPSFDAARYFTRCHRWSNEWEAVRIAQDYSPLAYHLMVNTDYRWVEVFLKHKPGITVIDSYDLVGGMYTEAFLQQRPDFADQIERERNCMVWADGICSRNREIDILHQKLGYELADSVRFLDGCWNQPEIHKPARPDDSIHIAFVGHVHDEHRVRDSFAAYGCNRRLAESITEQGIHLHVFPFGGMTPGAGSGLPASNQTPDGAFEWSSPYFHLHPSKPPDELIQALSACDFGLAVYPEHVFPTGAPWSVTEDKLEACVSNKYFDYIDADMPVLHTVSPTSFQGRLLSDYAVGINVRSWPISEWGRRLRELNIKKLRACVGQARQAYDVRRQAAGLIEFYERLRSGPSHVNTKFTSEQKEDSDADNPKDYRNHQPTLV